MGTIARTAVITGAGSGIGRATALELAANGVHVIAVGRRLHALEETRDLSHGGPITCVSADVSTEDGRAAIVEAAGPSVDFLVHGAAISPACLIGDPGFRDSWNEVMRINLDSLMCVTLSLSDQLSGGGRVLFVGSNSASKPRRGGAAYCVSKAGGRMLYRCLKLELGDLGILMTTAIPSPVYTDIVKHHIKSQDVFPDGADYARQLAAGEMIAPETVGAFYRWLLLENSDTSYARDQWNINHSAHHKDWLKGPLCMPPMDLDMAGD
ncbi:MAG: SDR family oxidoreductase [Rhodospirillales bacterium]|nr:SDR family oxidoreductase [Rhodospirillales bacterium]